MARQAYLAKRVTDQDPTMRYTPGSAVNAGNVIKVNQSAIKCIAGVAIDDIAASVAGAVDITNIYDITCSAAQTFAEGAQVFWDNEGSKAIPQATANGLDDFSIGIAVKARATTDKSFVRVRLNTGPYAWIRNSSSSSSSSSA